MILYFQLFWVAFFVAFILRCFMAIWRINKVGFVNENQQRLYIIWDTLVIYSGIITGMSLHQFETFLFKVN